MSKIYVLVSDGRIERASLKADKMYEAAKEANGENDPFGSWSVVPVELEDAGEFPK